MLGELDSPGKSKEEWLATLEGWLVMARESKGEPIDMGDEIVRFNEAGIELLLESLKDPAAPKQKPWETEEEMRARLDKFKWMEVPRNPKLESLMEKYEAALEADGASEMWCVEITPKDEDTPND